MSETLSFKLRINFQCDPPFSPVSWPFGGASLSLQPPCMNVKRPRARRLQIISTRFPMDRILAPLPLDKHPSSLKLTQFPGLAVSPVKLVHLCPILRWKPHSR